MKLQGKEIIRLWRGQKGFTLLEAVLAVAILGFIGAGMVIALDTNYRSSRTLHEQVTATNLATAYVEAIRELSYNATYPSAYDNISVPFQYSVVIDTQCSSDGITFSDCTGSDNETFQKIIVKVEREGRPILSKCSYRTKR